MKKVRKAGMEVSPPFAAAAASHGGMEARARNKYHGLLLDYEDLLKEIEAKKNRLQKAQEKKLRLSAEVKFLRRKYKRLSTNSSYRLKKQSQKSLPNAALQAEVLSKDRKYRVMEAPNISTILDLNQAFLPNGEEMEELQMEQEHPKAIANELKLSICRDVGTSGNRVGKRKISWQDQVALRV
ncbi:GrpE nucleotide exchange factor coiled-coil-containing protein [Dioscorea alata]|uniref:GrpE nucleotide exchange factor coiled-coil-containing protein n=1 Tax=Dioscorea alata TaxID=55571 RepID=A0ACB7VLN6_DIOAL|nr:GrpE nucleotide exchange factor coiled-coil-containing protein [Dioscorea alata]